MTGVRRDTFVPGEAGASPPALWKLVAIGLGAGLLSGAFGVGGGVLIVPALVLLTGMAQRTAHGTSLAAIVPISIVGASAYLLAGHTDLVIVGLLVIGTVLGAFGGVRLLNWLPEVWLRWLFIAFILVAAVRLFLEVPSRESIVDLTVLLTLALIVLGVLTGILSGLLGVGGGIFMVPVLILFFQIGDLEAKGVSLLVVVPTGILATVLSLRKNNVDFHAAAAIGLSGALTSVVGAATAWLLSPQIAAILFAIFLIIIAVRMAIHERPRKKMPPSPEKGSSHD